MADETENADLLWPRGEMSSDPKTGRVPALSDAPIFAPYEKTRPGFELVRAEVCEEGLPGEDFEDVGGGYFEVCEWDIWHWAVGEKNGTPKPDPAETDPEKQAINAMQRAIGELSEDDRMIRIQSACLNRCYITFPRNIDLVIEGIAAGKPNISEHISCEPPWNHSLLPLLRHRRKHTGGSDDRSHERRPLVRAYMTILDSYLAGASLDDLQEQLPTYAELARTSYHRLGSATGLKRLQVTRLRNALTLHAFPTQQWREAFEYVQRIDGVLSEVVHAEVDAEDDEFAGLIEKLHNGLCHQFFFRRIDHLIARCANGCGVVASGR